MYQECPNVEGGQRSPLAMAAVGLEAEDWRKNSLQQVSDCLSSCLHIANLHVYAVKVFGHVIFSQYDARPLVACVSLKLLLVTTQRNARID